MNIERREAYIFSASLYILTILSEVLEFKRTKKEVTFRQPLFGNVKMMKLNYKGFCVTTPFPMLISSCGIKNCHCLSPAGIVRTLA